MGKIIGSGMQLDPWCPLHCNFSLSLFQIAAEREGVGELDSGAGRGLTPCVPEEMGADLTRTKKSSVFWVQNCVFQQLQLEQGANESCVLTTISMT